VGVTTYKATTCASCGAPLEPPEGKRVVECGYCGRKLEVGGDTTRQVDESQARSLTDELLRGYSGRDTGAGKRFGVVEMRGRDWKCWQHGVWPIDGRASSSFGTGWGVAAINGAPRVYPRCGDKMGAWAPGTPLSKVEWVEASYDPKAPPVKAIRVFETCVPGATYALTLRGEGDEDELVWQRKPEPTGNRAQVLEIPLDPPRSVRAVRAYVANDLGARWSEIDTIGLVAVTPVPESMRRKPPRMRPVSKLLLFTAVIAVGVWVATTLFAKSDAASGASASESAAILPPEQSVGGAAMKRWNTDVAGMRAAGTVWASAVSGRSSEYGNPDWGAVRATGAPDVFPTHGDAKNAWATKDKNRGQEWISVRFPTVANAGSVIIVETFNPGALARIDDLSDPKAPVMLWRDSTSALGESRILSLELAEPRPISHLRILLDTTRVTGWNEIDAIGLVPRD